MSVLSFVFLCLSSLVSNTYSSVASAELSLLLGKCTWALKEVSSLLGLHFVGKTDTVSLDRVFFISISQFPICDRLCVPHKRAFSYMILIDLGNWVNSPACTLDTWRWRHQVPPKPCDPCTRLLQLMSTQYETVTFFWLLFLLFCMCVDRSVFLTLSSFEVCLTIVISLENMH